MTNLLDELYNERGELLDCQAHRTTQLDKDGYYREADPNITAKIADVTEQIEIAEAMLAMQEFDNGLDYNDADELYQIGMGR